MKRPTLEWWNGADAVVAGYAEVTALEVIEKSKARGDVVDYWRSANALDPADRASMAFALQRARGFAEFPKAIRQAIDRVAREATLRFVAFEESALRAHQLFEKHRLHALLGGALASAYRFYPEPFLRPVAKVEWILPGPLDYRFLRWLGQAGYRQLGAERGEASGSLAASTLALVHSSEPSVPLELKSIEISRFEAAWQRAHEMALGDRQREGGERVRWKGVSTDEHWLELMKTLSRAHAAQREVSIWDWVDLELDLKTSGGGGPFGEAWNWAQIVPALMHTRGVPQILQMLNKDRKVSLPKSIRPLAVSSFKRLFDANPKP